MTAFVAALTMLAALSFSSVAVAAPDLSLYSGGQRYFSPDGDGQEDSATVYYCLEAAANLTIKISDSSDRTVRTVEDGVSHAAGCGYYYYYANSVSWDGKDDAGAVVPDGEYTLRVHAVDAGG